MCILTMSAVGTALGMSTAAISAASAASAAGTSMLGVITGIANAAIGAAAISGIAGGVVGGVSSYQQGKAQQAQYDYQAKVNEENAKIAQHNADVQRQQGIEEARLQRLKTASVIGSQQAAMAANGIDVTQGTAVDVIGDTAAMGELDALQTQYNYEMKAYGYETEAGNFKNQANLDRISGKNAFDAGKMNAITHGIKGLGDSVSTVGNIATKWFM